MKVPFASVAAALFVTGLVAGGAHARALVRIGVPADMSGPNSDYTGPGSVEAACMAVEDFGRKVLGRPTEVMSADHQRFFATREAMSSETQVGVYSSMLHYLKSVQAAGTLASDQVMARMRDILVSNAFTSNGHVREDDLTVHDMYLVQGKAPAESTGPWDYVKVVRTIPKQDAFRPLWRTACPRLQR